MCAWLVFFSNELHVGWCNDNATSNPLYSHAIRIALVRPGTHEILPSVTDHNKLARPPDVKKRPHGQALRGGRVASSKRRRAKPGNNSKLPGRRDSVAYAIWRFLLNGSNGFAMWHLLLSRTKHYVEIIWRPVVSTETIFRIFRKQTCASTVVKLYETLLFL